MELNDAGRRVVGQHWRLILLFMAAGLLVGLLANGGGGTWYTASTRLTLDAPDPETQAEATIIADTGKAIATSPAQVARALADAHITGRNASEIARRRVSTRSFGTSGVLNLSVSDRDPRTAARIANALAGAVMSARADITRGATQRALAKLDQRIARLNQKISRLDARVESLNTRATRKADLDAANSLRVQRDAASRTRDSLAAQATVFQSERDRLESANALQPQAAVVSPATVPRHADSSGLSAGLVLGLLLGSILGIGVAALIETFRPTLVGGESLARELGMPLLGTFSTAPGEPEASEDVGHIAERLRLAGEAANVRRLSLVGVGQGVDVRPLAELLDGAVQVHAGPNGADAELAGVAVGAMGGRVGTATRKATSSMPARPAIRVRPVDFRSSALSNGGGTGLVLVSPSALKRAELADTRQLLQITPVPVLGLIAYGRPDPKPYTPPWNRREDL